MDKIKLPQLYNKLNLDMPGVCPVISTGLLLDFIFSRRHLKNTPGHAAQPIMYVCVK